MADPMGMLADSKVGNAIKSRLNGFADKIDRNLAKAAAIALVALPIIGLLAFFFGVSSLYLAVGAAAGLLFVGICLDNAFTSKYGDKPWFQRVHKIMEVTLKILMPLAIASVGALMIAQGPTSMLFYVGIVAAPALSMWFLGEYTLPAIADREYKSSPIPQIVSPAAQKARRGFSPKEDSAPPRRGPPPTSNISIETREAEARLRRLLTES